jgi:hypothetical protein
LEQAIVDVPGAQFAVREGEGARRGSGPADRAHHLNAVAGRFRSRSAGIGDAHHGVAAGRAAADDQSVGGRAVAPEHGIDGHRAAGSRIAGRRQDRARRGAPAHVHQAGIGDAGYGLTEAVEIERSAPRDHHCRIRAERVERACPQRPRVDVRQSAVAIGGCQRSDAREHIDSTAAADRGRKHVVGGRVIEVDRTGSSAKCDARRRERAGRSRWAARARADVEGSNGAGVRRDHDTPPSAIVSVPMPKLPMFNPELLLQVEPAPSPSPYPASRRLRRCWWGRRCC